MSKPIIYLAGPVSTGGAGSIFENAQRMIRWVKYFVKKDETRVYIAPWVGEVLAFIGEEFRPEFYQRVLDDDCEVVARLSGVCGVGLGGNGGWTKGMSQERATARAIGRPALDMTRFAEPEDVPEDFDLEAAWGAITPNGYMYKEPY
jgi:hypothetical protein